MQSFANASGTHKLDRKQENTVFKNAIIEEKINLRKTELTFTKSVPKRHFPGA